MISLMDCVNAIGPDGIKHKYIWCREGHKLGTGYIRGVDEERPLVCRRCQECPVFEPFDIPYEKEE